MFGNGRRTRGHSRPPAAGLLTLSVLVFAGTGCRDFVDTLLEVEAPGQILAKELDNPVHAELLVKSAISDFECAISAYIVAAGVLGDEFEEASTASGRWAFNQRNVSPQEQYGFAPCTSTGLPMYVPVSTARWQADNVLRKLQGDWADANVRDAQGKIATAAAIAGYSLVLLGEGMCSAAIDLSPEMFPQDFFQEAVDRFQTAIGAASDSRILNLARVGLGRARLNLGDKAGAASAVRDVPEGFAFLATRSNASDSRRNRIFLQNNEDRNISVEEDFWNLTFHGVPDARGGIVDENDLAADRLVPWWTQHKYRSRDDPIPVARWAEAQLITAEAEGGQTAVDIINDLHARAGLPPYDPQVHTTPGPTGDEILNHVIEERRRELIFESHHLGDVRRYGIPLTPAPGAPYPWSGGGLYGDQTCFPVPASEFDSNPNF